MHLIIYVLLTICVSAHAAILPRQAPCSFVMNAVSPVVNGSVVEDTIGENRIGGTYPQGNYYITNGSLVDGLGHSCVIISVSYQFQCFASTIGASDFSFADDGNLLQGGNENFFACPAPGPGDDGSYNIFGAALANTTGCAPITLRTGGFNCTALGHPTSTATSSELAASTSSTRAPASTSSALSTSDFPTSTIATAIASSATTVACPTDFSSGFLFPQLIVPTSPEAPDHAFGSSYSAYISPVNTTLFNFDVPPTNPYNGDCALLFLFPFGAATYFSGTEEEEGEHGGLEFALLTEVANNQTTYDTTSNAKTDFGQDEVLPGNNYTIGSFYCGAGEMVTFSVSSKGNVELDYFQNSGGLNPIGLYLIPCKHN
jgi:hypothetical protein